MSEDRVNPYQIQGSRVYGQGMSINCTNIVTAQQLCNTLNQYEQTIQHYNEIQTQNLEIEKKLDKVTRQIINIQMTLNTLKDEINILKEMV